MSIASYKTKVGEKPEIVYGPDPDGSLVSVKVTAGDSEVAYLGNAEVSLENGFPMSKDDAAIVMTIGPNEELYAIAEKSVFVHILATLNE